MAKSIPLVLAVISNLITNQFSTENECIPSLDFFSEEEEEEASKTSSSSSIETAAGVVFTELLLFVKVEGFTVGLTTVA